MESPENPSGPERRPSTETSLFPVLNAPLQKRYDRIAPAWNGPAYEGIRRDDLIPKLVDAARMADGLAVLEAMSGTGLLSSAIKKQFPATDAYALDFSRGMLNEVGEGVRKVESSVISTPFADRMFDRVFLRSALYDLPRQAQMKALQEIRRVLKRNGLFILQTYYTEEDTKDVLNSLVNLKDLASGQYQDMGSEPPRYFATPPELEEWFARARFDWEPIEEFSGTIRYTKTGEMSELGKAMWADHVAKLPDEAKQRINLRQEGDGAIVFDFPGRVYRLGGWGRYGGDE